MSAYTVPAHNLRNLPARISFEAARAEALGGVHGETDCAPVAQEAAPLAPVLADAYSTPKGDA
jgi:hypothetical protein